MHVFIIDNGSKHIRSLKKMLQQYNPVTIAYGQIESSNVLQDDLVIISGGGHGIPIPWHDKEYAKEIELIISHRGPIIGICLGFELITHVFGSHLHFMAHRRQGSIDISSINAGDILNGVTNVRVHEGHSWSVQSLSAPLIGLAKSEDGIEILRHDNRPIYGLQFHPEVSDTGGKTIFVSVMKRLGFDLKI